MIRWEVSSNEITPLLKKGVVATWREAEVRRNNASLSFGIFALQRVGKIRSLYLIQNFHSLFKSILYKLIRL